MKVPVQNVYYLLLYAWDRIGDQDAVSVAEQGYTRLQDLFAHVLADTVARLLARGLDRDYLAEEESVRGVRGKLDLPGTVKRNHLVTAQTRCRYDELSYDILHNRIIKTTLRALLEVDLAKCNADRVRRLYQKLDSISDVRLTRRDFGRVQLHGNNVAYDFALAVCRVIYDNMMIEPGSGRAQFREFEATQQQMGALFESFIFNFLKREQQTFRVTRPRIDWYDVQSSASDVTRLPKMRTDVVLESGDRRILLDCKFYAEPLKSRTLDSKHLYQILAYLANSAAPAANTPPHEGVLLYPVVGEKFRFDYRLNGFPVSIRSLDLSQPWVEVRHDLLRLVDSMGP